MAYLAGTSYCGSTLLAFLMDRHPDIASIGEVALAPESRRKPINSYLCSCGAPIVGCKFWNEVFQAVQASGVSLNVSNWTHDFTYFNPLVQRVLGVYSDRRSVQNFHRLMTFILPVHRQKVRKASRASVVFMRAVMDRTNARIFFDATKSLMRLYHLLRIRNLDVRVVWLIRDVRAYVRSCQKLAQSGIEESATVWKRYHVAADQILSSLPREKVFRLRYEDLLTHRDIWMPELCEFLGVPSVEMPSEINACEHHIIGNSMRLRGHMPVTLNEDWRSELTRQQQAEALRVAGELNTRFGYASVV
jgi:hypothetical protein